jgi:hypothetical protein
MGGFGDRFKRQKMTFAFPGDSQTVALHQRANEDTWVKAGFIDVSALPNTVTAVVTVTDPDGYVWYTSGAITGGTAQSGSKFGDDITAAEKGEFPTATDFTITMTLSGALSSAKTAYIVLGYKF